jgi:hypothetical protein
MNKLLIFSILTVFTIAFSSCGMMDKKEEKEKKPSHSTHRRYHAEPSKDS